MKLQKVYIFLLFLGLVGLTLPICFCAKKKEISGLKALVEVVNTKRLTEGRLSGGFKYGLLKRPTSLDKSNSNQDPFFLADNTSRGFADVDNKSLSDAALVIYNQIEKAPNLTQKHELALLNILEGRYTKAIEYLESVIAKYPKDTSSLLNDLAVAYLERGDTQGNPKDLIHSLSLIDEALAINNNMLEAKFNKALLSEKLYLNSQSEKYWQEYLTVEKNEDWYREANNHIIQLKKVSKLNDWTETKKQLVKSIETEDIHKLESIVKDFPHRVRIYVLNELIPEWAKEIKVGNKLQAIKLANVSLFIGQIIDKLQDDKTIINISLILIEVNKDSSREALLSIGYLTYDQGRKALEQYESQKAKELFKKAIVLFAQAKDENGKAWTNFQIARCEMLLSDYENAISKLKKITNFAKEKKLLYLLARIYWVIGLIESHQFKFSDSFATKQLALEYLEKVKDNEGIAVVNSLIAMTLIDLKEQEEVWGYQYKALLNISKIIDSNWTFIVFIAITPQLYSLNEIRAATYFYQELNELANKKENQTYKFLALLESSRLQLKLFNNKQALHYLEKAEEQLNKITDPAFHLSSQHQLFITKAKYKVNNDPQAAIAELEELSKILPKDDQLYKTALLQLKSKAYLALKEYEKAEETLKEYFQVFESQRNKITDERYRLSFFEEPQAVYEDMIKLQINQRQRLDVAFDYVELARSRALLDAIDGRAKAIKLDKRQDLQLEGTAKPFTLSQVQKALPKTVTLIRYLMTKDKIFAWVIDKDKVNLVEQEINETQLEQQIVEMRKTIINFNSKPQEIESAIFPVYNAIFAKIKPLIKQNADQTLIIIPDKALYAVPFNALIDPETKRYLIEDFPLGSAPSATVYLRCLERDKQLSKNINEKVLAIGNPSFSQEHFKGMRYLSSAEKEAQAVSEIYSSTATKLLLTKDATKETFLKELSNYNVIHYAGHALVDPASPLFSKLLFAFPDNAPSSYDEAVYAHEIYGQQFNQTKLVILAACRTAGGQRTKGEGMISLARPFLAKGVPAVVASLWDADDKASLELFKTFHQERLAGKNSLVAMQKAQIKLLKSSYFLENHPRMWSLFQVIGGVNPN